MRWAPLLLAALVLAAPGCRRRGAKDYDRPLRPGEQALREVPPSEWPRFTLAGQDRDALLRGIHHSLEFLDTPTARAKYPAAGIDRRAVADGLLRFAELVRAADDDRALDAALRREFRLLTSVGWDGRGTVLFTGYYTPIFEASRTRTTRFRFPLHRRPDDFIPPSGPDALARQRLPDGTTRPYPGRRELMASGALRGLELVYLAEPFDPYIIQVQGSAKLRLRDGSIMEVGNHGITGHRYVPVADLLVADGHLEPEERNLAAIRAFFRRRPDLVDDYVNRNPRFVFFTESPGGPFGSLGQPVTAGVSIATDKTIFPPGALTWVSTSIGSGRRARPYAAFRLDQDTGGAIRAPGRCDLYMGEGPEAERLAGTQWQEGRLYYLVLR